MPTDRTAQLRVDLDAIRSDLSSADPLAALDQAQGSLLSSLNGERIPALTVRIGRAAVRLLLLLVVAGVVGLAIWFIRSASGPVVVAASFVALAVCLYWYFVGGIISKLVKSVIVAVVAAAIVSTLPDVSERLRERIREL